MRVNKKRCVATVDGKIIQKKNRGLDFPTLITVEYEINNNVYRVTESLKLKSRAIKLWVFPIGQMKYPGLPNTDVGTFAKVCYNEFNSNIGGRNDGEGEEQVCLRRMRL